MNSAVLVFYWLIYIVCGIVIQQHLPGLDALTPGFLIALQSGRKRIIFWIFIVFVLIQEGAGSLQFGSGILWYGGQIAIYFVISRLVMATGLLGSVIFAGLFTVYSAFIHIFISAIQEIPLNYPHLMETSVIQGISIPLIWLLAKGLRNRMIPHVSD